MNFKNFNFKEAIHLYSSSFFILLFCFISIRIIEFSWFQLYLHQTVPWKTFISKSVNYDLLFLGFIYFLGFIPFILLYVINLKVAQILHVFWGILLALIQISLTHFFLTNQTLLSSVVFQFSFKEIIDIVIAEFVLSKSLIFSIWIIVLFTTLYLLIKSNRWRLRKKWQLTSSFLFLIFIGNSIFNISYAYKPIYKFKTIPQFLFANSKPLFLYRSYKEDKHSKKLVNYNQIKNHIKQFQNSNPQNNYTNLEYPLVKNNKTKNVLGPFFKSTETPPHIVLIISESLSTSFSVDATGLDGASLTPFTDSLAANGLYWSHFLSNCHRSFGVLPNILSSLPPSKYRRGLINMTNKRGESNYPQHQSLVSILNNNQYNTNHFYAGWGGFDHTTPYTFSLGIDHNIEKFDFDTISFKLRGHWGFSDYDLYRKGLNDLKCQKQDQPTFSIYQTIAFHSPYDMLEPKFYKKKYLKSKMDKLKQNIDKSHLNKISNNQLSSIFASDEALEYLFNRLKETKEFENTIFIITGDHGTGIRLNDHALYKYHVPLIIYSPLLKKSKKFKGVCSHIDITPSLLALLNENFGIQLPEKTHWLGQGLDTSAVFTSNNIFPLQLNGMIRPNYIHKEHILFENKVYRLNQDFSLTVEKDQKKSNIVKENFETFKTINLYTTENDKVWSFNL